MKNLLLFVSLILLINCADAQHAVPSFKPNAAVSDNPFTGIKNYDLLLACRAYDNINHTVTFNVMVLKGGHWQKLTYMESVQSIPLSVIEPALKELPTKDAQCDSTYQAMTAAKLFTIDDDSKLPKCNETLDVVDGAKQIVAHSIEDGPEYRIWVATPKKMRYLYYYAPEFFAKFCPNKKDRADAVILAGLFTKGW
ncbi:hypothetical protein [Mucilaginibacter sp. dw_454]|uniref:hypothetical protein n=1 Tax=Mucilaginibacter sp. dw_454 TaxID=2720079 RepID=UPI001BD41F87|nr:hypothetical protein [Mucilaginibacter sp. dw_454]